MKELLEDETEFAFSAHPQPRRKEVAPILAPVAPPLSLPLPMIAPAPPEGKVAIGTLGLDGPLLLDVDKLLETRLLIQASSGGGKSWLLRKILEETHGRVCQIVIDPEGEFGSLIEHFDYALARPKVVSPEVAGELAASTLRSGRSLIVDLYELERDDRVLFVQHLVEGLMSAEKEIWRPCLVVVDEAHMFIPDKVTKLPSAKPLIDLASRGRKRGFACILSTQRLSKLHKDAAAECLNKLIGRTSLERDLRRASDELGMRGSRANALRTLKPGHFFAYGPALLSRPEIAVIGPVKTKHCSKQVQPDANLDVDDAPDDDELEEAIEEAPAAPRRSACRLCGGSGHNARTCPTAQKGGGRGARAEGTRSAPPAADRDARSVVGAVDLEADLIQLETMLAVTAGLVASIRAKMKPTK